MKQPKMKQPKMKQPKMKQPKMKQPISALLVWASLLVGVSSVWSADKKPLEAGAFSAVKNNVIQIDGTEKKQAQKDGKLVESNKVDTGMQSCTELTFQDSSLLRMGQNSHFSFDSKERMIHLEKGAMLMHVPPGNGGVSVETGGVVGAVSGSTVMATADGKGNFGFVVMETEGGSGKITGKDGTVTTLTSGQMGVISANQSGGATVKDINVTALMGSSPLFSEFSTPMAGAEKMQAVAQKQAEAIESGVGGFAQDSGAEGKSGGAEDSVANVLAALTGMSPEECTKAPNLTLNSAKAGGENQSANLATAFAINTDAGGEVSAKVAAGSAQFVPTGSATAVPISSNQGFFSSTGQVVALGSGDTFVGTGASMVADARSGKGKAVAASSMAPSDAGGPGDVATAAGGGDVGAGPGDVATAAGGGDVGAGSGGMGQSMAATQFQQLQAAQDVAAVQTPPTDPNATPF